MTIKSAAARSDQEPVRVRAWIFAALAVAGIWVGVLLAGLLSPDLAGDWIWGVLATMFVVSVAVAGIRAGEATAMVWVVLALVGSFVWTMLFVVSILMRPVLLGVGVVIAGGFVIWALVRFSGRSSPRES